MASRAWLGASAAFVWALLLVAAPREVAGQVIDLEIDDNPPADPGPRRADRWDSSTPAKRLFDEQRWNEAASLLHQAATKGPEADRERQVAEYYLAITLYRLELYHASYEIFGSIAGDPRHLKFPETLFWLAKLSTRLPEAAGVHERVGQYSASRVARYNTAEYKSIYWQLSYLLGRDRYESRKYQDASSLLQQVHRSSPRYVHSQFLMAASYVELRQSVPALAALGRVLRALRQGARGVDETRMRNLAHLSMARIFYSASIALDPETNAPSVNARRISAAVKYWDRVEPTSEYWSDALFEKAWAYFMAGHYPRAMGAIHTLQSPHLESVFYPEAEMLKAVIYFSNCNYDAGTTIAARLNHKYVPIKDELTRLLKMFRAPEREQEWFEFLLKSQTDTTGLEERVRPLWPSVFRDRQLLRTFQYVRTLDAERKRLASAHAVLLRSPLGRSVARSLATARELAVRDAGERALQRLQAYVSELNERVRNAENVLLRPAIIPENLLDEKIQKGQVSKSEARMFGKIAYDDQHIVWPFNGEYWRDELGTYQQVVESACGR